MIRYHTATRLRLDSAAYGYNTANQRTTFSNAAGTYYLYNYDNIGQLTNADSSTNSEDRSYVYDAAWNLNWLTNNGSNCQFIVDNKNELTNLPFRDRFTTIPTAT